MRSSPLLMLICGTMQGARCLNNKTMGVMAIL